jgi:hypothetical protein
MRAKNYSAEMELSRKEADMPVCQSVGGTSRAQTEWRNIERWWESGHSEKVSFSSVGARGFYELMKVIDCESA